MARLDPQQVRGLTDAIHTHDFLHRILRRIEQLQQIVFHDLPEANWKNARRSAEQILIAEIVTRYHGEIDGVYFALRKREKEGSSWEAAIRDLAASMQSYFTTPLGIIMRRDLFGEDAVFLSPEAVNWMSKEKAGI